jgi:hypothetical protein
MLSLLIHRKEKRDTTPNVLMGGSCFDNDPSWGCSGPDTVPTEEKEAGEEKATQAEAPVESLPSHEPGPDTDTEICQIQEALEDLGPQGLQRLTDELSEEVSAGRFANMQEALASRGYTCNGQVG